MVKSPKRSYSNRFLQAIKRPAHQYLPRSIDHRIIVYLLPASMGTLDRQTRFACDGKRIKRRSRADVKFGKRRFDINCLLKHHQ